jgi:ornithine carbamoyltransferase
MPTRHFLSTDDFSKKELMDVLFSAKEVKSKPNKYADVLKGKVIGLLFNKPSTRTRVSFEAGIYQLGGSAIFLTEKEIQIGRGESIADTAKVLSRYLNGIVIRTFDHQHLVEFSQNSQMPVINGLSDLLHPCQILADVFTILEKKKKIDGIKIAYIGDGSNNMAHSWIQMAGRIGLTLSIATPSSYPPDKKILESSDLKNIEITDDIKKAAKNADVLYTDVWVSMGQEIEREKRLNQFKNYQINKDILKIASPGAIVMHCLPAHPGEEITKDVLYGPQSCIFDEAENRLHAQKALMIKLVI